MEAAIQSLKKGKSAGVKNIPAELVQACGEDIITVLTTIMRQDLADRRMAKTVDPVLSHHTSQIGNLQQYQNYRTISLISHPSKIMLKIILNRLKPQAEKTIAEEEAGLRAGRSTTEQIFNLQIL